MSMSYITSFGDVNLTVTPDKMYETANSIENAIGASKKLFSEMINIITATSEYWDGMVADQERSNFNNENENFEALISNLNNYVSELRSITSIYEITEQEQKSVAEYLPVNILE